MPPFFIYHIRTDPTCQRFREPKGMISRFRFNRNRGKSCWICRSLRCLHAQRIEITKISDPIRSWFCPTCCVTWINDLESPASQYSLDYFLRIPDPDQAD